MSVNRDLKTLLKYTLAKLVANLTFLNIDMSM